ncbi:MAG: hypothetical protein HY928_12050 [Elusimicrobia bacterium]|nr:hypothetical protein [Elusimicrobiota bacterium]
MNLSELAGQPRAVRVLRRLLETRALPPALLFHGPDGVGKAAAAAAFARALNCTAGARDACPAPAPGTPASCPSCAAFARGLDPDFQRVDAEFQAGLSDKEAAKQRSLSVDTVRHAVRRMEMRSMEGRWKSAVVVDAHTLTPSAANAMLKGLEEPPPRSVWVLVTHRPSELLPTVRSRCQPVAFAALGAPDIARILTARGVGAAEAAAAAADAQGSASRAAAAVNETASVPAAWLSDPMAPFTLAEGLPRELHLSRPRADELVSRAAAWLRRTRGAGAFSSADSRFVLRDIEALRERLRRNCDPRLVTMLAAIRLQELDAVEKAKK